MTWRWRWGCGRVCRSFTVALILDILIAAVLSWRQATGDFVDYFNNQHSGRIALGRGIAKVFGADPERILGWLTGRVFGEFLFVLFLYALFTFFHKSWPGRLLIDYGWPGIPDILDPNLGAPKPGYFGPGRLAGDFMEREDELRALLRFAGDDPKGDAVWLQINGAEGIGKTRLALETLQKLRAQGWDVGTLREGVSAQDIRRARLRRKTAILIENAGGDGELWTKVAMMMAKRGRRLRVLVESQAAMITPLSLKGIEGEVITPAERPSIRLGGLSAKAIKMLAPHLSDGAVAATEGRPLFAQVDAAEIVRRVAQRLAGPEPNVATTLGLAALAGPIVFNQLSEDDRENIDKRLVSFTIRPNIFDGADKATLRKMLPALTPDNFANEAFYQAIDDLDSLKFVILLNLAISCNAEATEQRLASLWQMKDLPDNRAAILQNATDLLEQRRPDIGELRRRQTTYYRNCLTEEYDFEEIMVKIIEMADRRPYDKGIRLIESQSIVVAVTRYGQMRQFADLERWGQRMISLAEDDRFAGDVNIHLNCAVVAMVAMDRYGNAGLYADLEQWGKRLIAVAEGACFRTNPDIRLQEAIAASNAIATYGEAGRFKDLEMWARRLVALLNDEVFRFDSKIHQSISIGIRNAIVSYGNMNFCYDAERWLTYLIEINSLKIWADDPALRLEEAVGATSAMNAYGAVGKFDDLERWGDWLVKLTEDARFSSHAHLRVEEARAAASSMLTYALAGQLDKLDDWSRRLVALAEDERFSSILEIRVQEARGARNAIGGYGKSGRFQDLEHWGKRLIALTDDARFSSDGGIRLEDAQGAWNAVWSYGTAGLFDDLDRWGRRLVALAEDARFALDTKIWAAIAWGASSAALHLGKAAAAWETRRHVYFLLIAVAGRRFPEDSNIQSRASDFKLTYGAQSARGWPYGRPDESRPD